MRAGRPAFPRPCEGVHRSTSLTSSSLLLYQCPACLVRLTLIVFVMGGRWPYSCCFLRVLPPGLVQYCSQHSCVVAVKLFPHPFRLRPGSASIQQYTTAKSQSRIYANSPSYKTTPLLYIHYFA